MSKAQSSAPGRGELTDRADSPSSMFPQRGGAVQVSTALPRPTVVAQTAWCFTDTQTGFTTGGPGDMRESALGEAWSEIGETQGSGLTGSSEGAITVGSAAAGKMVIVEGQVAMEPGSGASWPSMRLKLAGAGPTRLGVEPVSEFQSFTTTVTGGVDPHFHFPIDNPFTLQVSLTFIAADGDTFWLDLTAGFLSSVGSAEYNLVPGSAGSRRIYIRATALG